MQFFGTLWARLAIVAVLAMSIATVDTAVVPADRVAAQDAEPTVPELTELTEVDAPEARPHVLLVVEDLDDGVFQPKPGEGMFGIFSGINRVEMQLASILGGFTDLDVVDEDDVEPEHLHDVDLVVIAASTNSNAFKPFYLKAAVPIIAMKPANWNALGLAERTAEATTPLQQLQWVTVDRSHPIAAGLNARHGVASAESDDAQGGADLAQVMAEVQLFSFGAHTVGRGWALGAEPSSDRHADVVATGPDGAAMIAFEPGDLLGWAYVDPSDTAIACRVAFPSNGSTEATFTGDGVSLFVGAVEWSLRDECRSGTASVRPSTSAAMCRTQKADEDRIARADEIVERGPNDQPNLSSLWVRAIEYTELDGTPIAFIGGRFQRAYDAPATVGDAEVSRGVRRMGVFGCDLSSGTVTDFDVPIVIDSLAPRGDAVLNERVRALAFDGTWLYVGGKFRLTREAFGDLEPPDGFETTPAALVRVDPRTGAIDPTWTPNLQGSVSALELHDGWLYAGGGIRLADDTPANRLVRIGIGPGATGVTDPDFRPNIQATIGVGDDDPFASVLALTVVNNVNNAVAGETLVVGGSFQEIDGTPRNSLAAFDLATGELTDFAPSIGDNNVGTDPIPQIKDVVEMPDGSILACGDWWVISPTPGLTWTAYDHDGGAVDPNVEPDSWFGQRSKIQPRPNQFNHGKFDLQTGAAAMVDGVPWGPVTDGGIQACAVDPISNVVVLAGHYESSGTYVAGFEPVDTNDYPPTHVAYEKLTMVDATTGEIIAWDPDIDSIRGLDAVAIVPGEVVPGGDRRNEIIIGGAMTTADRVSRDGLARFVIR